ncbi:MAG: nitronate monooxygenase [Solirubrobacterales bacterium]|nr:nitronate monooxygenase [Solirubrobacterales bacterium]MBV9536055.1 nitronate monooxygenase [Solirubrobacterales bacterium]
MTTPVCELLGIRHPVVQAPIAAAPPLAAAVSEAGALGTVALTWVDDVKAIVAQTAAATDRPFAGNLVLAWDQRHRLDQALEAGLRIVSLASGDPAGHVEQAHDAGALVLHTVGSPEEARRSAALGVDVIVAQGWEAGGHVWGTIATLPLVPAVVDAVAPVPVIAAGGIGDARGVSAVLALGAQAAWLGTRFLVAQEAPVHSVYKQRVLEAAETDAVWYRDLYDIDWPKAAHRALRNATAAAWETAGCPPPGARPGEGEPVATRADGEPIVRYSCALPLTDTSGDIAALSLWAGQSVALARREQPAAEIVAELVSRL